MTKRKPKNEKVIKKTAVAGPKAKGKRSPPPEVEVLPSTCPKCGSANRTGYNATKEREISGTTRDGRPYVRIEWKRTKCTDCNQNRVDVFYLNRATKKR